MTIDKHNPTRQRQQPRSLSQVLSRSTERYLWLPVSSTSNSRRDPEEQQAFLRSMLELAIEIANEVADLRSMLEQAIETANEVADNFSEDSSSVNTDGHEEREEENSSSQNRNQNK
jgi:hypothetical protein